MQRVGGCETYRYFDASCGKIRYVSDPEHRFSEPAPSTVLKVGNGVAKQQAKKTLMYTNL